MAVLGVLASGNGSNFEAIARAVEPTRHRVAVLIHDRRDAFAAERAARLGIPAVHLSYAGRTRDEAESAIATTLEAHGVDLVALAGFMRLLSPRLIDRYPGRILNIHPSLLPDYPGVSAITDAHGAGETETGVTVHRVDYGMDTGPIIAQERVSMDPEESPDDLETRIHAVEHRLYPSVVLAELNALEET